MDTGDSPQRRHSLHYHLHCHPHIQKMPKMRISNQLRELVLVEAGCRVCSAEIQHLDRAHLVVFVNGRLTEAIQVLVIA